MNTTGKAFALAGLLLLAAGSAGAENILVDPSFEGLTPTGTRAPGEYLGGHTDGWYVLTGGCYLYWVDWFGVPPPGQVAHLNNSTLQQVMPTVTGQQYAVSFFAVGSDSISSNNHATVWIDDGNIVGTGPAGSVTTFDTGQVNAGWSWPTSPYTFSFTAASVQTTLSVRGFNNVPVDAFVVEGSSTPPPATWHPGDANKDGLVNLEDFGLLKDNFGATAGATWAMGDFNGDGGINLEDFGILKDHFGHTSGDSPLTAIPEPASAALMLMGLGALARRRPLNRKTRS